MADANCRGDAAGSSAEARLVSVIIPPRIKYNKARTIIFSVLYSLYNIPQTAQGTVVRSRYGSQLYCCGANVLLSGQ